jgi:hypothetical protein
LHCNPGGVVEFSASIQDLKDTGVVSSTIASLPYEVCAEKWVDCVCVCVCVCVCTHIMHYLIITKMLKCIRVYHLSVELEIEAQRGFTTCPLTK